MHTISKNDVVEKFHFDLMKFTFFQLGIKFDFSKLVQNNLNMSSMLFQVLGENEDVINVIDHEIIQVLMKNIIHEVLKDSKCIRKANGHHNILKIAIACT